MARLTLNDSEFKLKYIKSTVGPNGLDVRSLYKESGFFTYDPAFMSTASCASSITFINGAEGVLRYRGYNAVDLAQKYDFLTTAYLLLNEELPTQKEYTIFTEAIKTHSDLEVQQVINSFARTSHPMSMLIASFSALAAIHHTNNMDFSVIAIAQIPSIIAAIYRHTNNLPIVHCEPSLGYVENFLHMMFGNNKHLNNTLISSLNSIFTLHADHEQNASTATVRLSASSGANPFACLAAGSATLWGPAHGGANEAVIKMLNTIQLIDNVPNFIQKVKNKEVLLMGFGHRVYKNYDPRAAVLRNLCHKILEIYEQDNNILEIALQLEEIALKDDYFLERKLYPNVDFYSGIIFQAIGIPTNMFTNLFALARTSGWVAQLYEAKHDQQQKINRPRQIYIGEKSRELK